MQDAAIANPEVRNNAMRACVQPEIVQHPFFARVYVRVAAAAEKRGQSEHRAELLRGLSGRVLELGAGNGMNFRHYPGRVRELVAVEPESRLRQAARDNAAQAKIPIRIVDGVASRLPFAESSFDAGVVCLVLCSVPDQAQALAELYRVIRPGGELRFYEHVLATTPGRARLQRLADRLFWSYISGNCHASRDTLSAISLAGFQVEACRRLMFSSSPLFAWTKPHVLGVARRPPGHHEDRN